ncbi:hypothetical protein [Amycolatopsis sp. lyj-112]|uniref:hypothetical protein n=1 Tax=Amycolatopsis sp. lyj-112 TaxID=2789288 RepID=UPI00397D468A
MIDRRVIRAVMAVFAACALLTVVPGSAAASGTACTWEQSTLPLPPGQTSGHVSGAANSGWFVGGGPAGAIRWHNGVAENLGRAFGNSTEMRDINSSGTAVGLTHDGGGTFGKAVVYRDGGFTALPVPPGRRTTRALDINDAGDIVGTAQGIGDTFDLTIWPANAPGTVLTINPDPSAYGYVSSVDIDEQGRILIDASLSESDFFVREPDGTMTKLPLGSQYVTAFRNGRIAGEIYENEEFSTLEWDVTGQPVRRLDRAATSPAVDSGTLTTGVYRTADKGYALGVWDNGVLTQTLATSPTHGVVRSPVITGDGVIATAIGSAPTAFRRSCG